MAQQSQTPSAEVPTNVAESIHGLKDVHTKTESDFSQTGLVEYEVIAWVEGDDSAVEVAEIVGRMERGGYEVETVSEVEANGHVKIKATATNE